MNLAYMFLSLTTLTALFIKNKSLLWGFFGISVLLGFYLGVIHIYALPWIALFLAACHFYFSNKTLNQTTKHLFLALITVLTAGFSLNFIPGFSNMLALDNVRFSALSSPFSMYLNFDKVMAGIILYATSSLHETEKSIDKKSINQTALYFMGCIVSILGPAYFSSYVGLDFKIPDFLWIWTLNNLLFVCMGEEVIYRGFLQKTLKSFLKKTNCLHIFIASVIFGLSHYRQGTLFMILASICGVFYGYTYDKTNRIVCSILVHFGLNLTHLILFTYPAALNK